MRMIVCPTCGNKRCPKAASHENACTGSNEVGQPGSSWANFKPHPYQLAAIRALTGAFANQPVTPPHSAWIRVSDGLPVIPEGQYRTEVLTTRLRDDERLRAVAFYGGSSEGNERRGFYIVTADRDEFGDRSITHNYIEPTHWQALPDNPED